MKSVVSKRKLSHLGQISVCYGFVLLKNTTLLQLNAICFQTLLMHIKMDVKNEVCFKTKVRQELCCIKTQPNNILFLNATCFYELCQTSYSLSLSRVFCQSNIFGVVCCRSYFLKILRFC